MKKLVLSTMIIGSTIAISCNKNDSIPSEPKNSNPAAVTQVGGRWTTFYDFGGPLWLCADPDGPCSPYIVIITPTKLQTYTNFVNVIRQGNNANIKSFVSNNYSTLVQDIEASSLNLVLNNVTYLALREDAQNLEKVVLFKNFQDNTLKAVHRIKL